MFGTAIDARNGMKRSSYGSRSVGKYLKNQHGIDIAAESEDSVREDHVHPGVHWVKGLR